MSWKRAFFLISLGWAFIIFTASAGWVQPNPQTEVKAPIITHYYAADKGRFGFTWKIYIEAEDPNGDMDRIVSEVDQVGYGFYPVDYIRIKPPYRSRLKGYLQWNTFSNQAPFLREGTQITLKVSILDKAGNESNKVIFPLEFVVGLGREQPKPPAPFDRADIPRLGNITINLAEPTAQEPGSNR